MLNDRKIDDLTFQTDIIRKDEENNGLVEECNVIIRKRWYPETDLNRHAL